MRFVYANRYSMKEFRGRPIFFFFSLSRLRSSTGRRTHCSISIIGTSAISIVNLLSGTVKSQVAPGDISPHERARRFRTEWSPMESERDLNDEMGDEMRPFGRLSGVVEDIATRKAGTVFGNLFNHKRAR